MLYIVLVKESCIRDAQVYVGLAPDDPYQSGDLDTDWTDLELPAYLGAYTADSASEAVIFAAEEHGLPVSSLKAVTLEHDEKHYDTLEHLFHCYELDIYPADSQEYIDKEKEFIKAFGMTPDEAEKNTNGILDKATALFYRYQNANVPENDTWDFVAGELEKELKHE